jgi:hypothetical protein
MGGNPLSQENISGSEEGGMSSGLLTCIKT